MRVKDPSLDARDDRLAALRGIGQQHMRGEYLSLDGRGDGLRALLRRISRYRTHSCASLRKPDDRLRGMRELGSASARRVVDAGLVISR